MRYIVVLIATALVPFTFAGSAEATRPMPGFKYPDVCKNIKGTQTMLDITSGAYSFKTRKNGKRVCVSGWQSLPRV